MINPSKVKEGSKIWVDGQKRPYLVRTRDDRYIIATKPFNPQRTVLYFIIDLLEERRGPDDTVFCRGYESDGDTAKRLTELQRGEICVSYRRCVHTHMVDAIKI